MRRVTVGLGLVGIVMFVGFAALQLNDPDPWLWVPIYLVPAAACALAVAGRLPRWVPIAVAVVALLGTIPEIPPALHAAPIKIVTDLRMHEAGVEEAREALGLLIIAAWMGALAALPRERA